MKTMDIDTVSFPNAIEQAIKDVIKVEKSQFFKIDMQTWGTQTSEVALKVAGQKVNMCSVCFGGAVISQNYEDYSTYVSPEQFEAPIRDTLYSLDSLRSYQYRLAIHKFFGSEMSKEEKNELAKSLEDLNLKEIRYYKNPTVFKSNMRKIVKHLRKLGY